MDRIIILCGSTDSFKFVGLSRKEHEVMKSTFSQHDSVFNLLITLNRSLGHSRAIAHATSVKTVARS